MMRHQPPASPASAAPITNAATLYRVVGTPTDSDAIAFSRSANSARPDVAYLMLCTM